MANYYTQFSFIIPKLSDTERTWVATLEAEQERYSTLDLFKRLFHGQDYTDTATLDHHEDIGFVQFGDDEYVGFEAELEDGDLWIHDGGDSGTPEHAANFVTEFLRRFRPDDAIGFEWANTCSKPLIDAFGGGAAFITATDTRWLSTSNWLFDQQRGKP